MGVRLKLMGRWISRRLPWRSLTPEPPKVPRAELWPKVHDILAKQFNVPSSGITPQAKFAEDLMIDSLESIELVMAVEEEFGIEIPDEEAEKLLTVSDLLLCLEDKLSRADRPDRG